MVARLRPPPRRHRRPRFQHHHAPLHLEGLRSRRRLLRPHGRLQRVQAPLPRRPALLRTVVLDGESLPATSRSSKVPTARPSPNSPRSCATPSARNSPNSTKTSSSTKPSNSPSPTTHPARRHSAQTPPRSAHSPHRASSSSCSRPRSAPLPTTPPPPTSAQRPRKASLPTTKTSSIPAA